MRIRIYFYIIVFFALISCKEKKTNQSYNLKLKLDSTFYQTHIDSTILINNTKRIIINEGEIDTDRLFTLRINNLEKGSYTFIINSKLNKIQTHSVTINQDTTIIISNKINFPEKFISFSELSESDTILCVYYFSSCDFNYSENLSLIRSGNSNNYNITITGSKGSDYSSPIKFTNNSEILDDIYCIENELKFKKEQPLSTTTQHFVIFTNKSKFEAKTDGDYKFINYIKLKKKFTKNGS